MRKLPSRTVGAGGKKVIGPIPITSETTSKSSSLAVGRHCAVERRVPQIDLLLLGTKIAFADTASPFTC